MNHNTLHLCHLEAVKCLDSYRRLIKSNDAVIFYATSLSNQQVKAVTQQFQQYRHYFVCDESDKPAASITYDDWVELTDQYAKTFSWK